MALPVRPQVWPPAPNNVAPGRNDARMQAQKAFFEAALGKTGATAQATSADPSPARPTASAAQAVRSVADVQARSMDRLPPPGSIINILV